MLGWEPSGPRERGEWGDKVTGGGEHYQKHQLLSYGGGGFVTRAQSQLSFLFRAMLLGDRP